MYSSVNIDANVRDDVKLLTDSEASKLNNAHKNLYNQSEEVADEFFHAEVDEVHEDLDVALRLHVAAHHAEAEPRRAILRDERGNDRVERSLARRVGVRVAFFQHEHLAAILQDLESSKPYLFVDQVMIYKQQTYTPPGAKAVTPPLDVRFNLSGYLRQPGGKAGQPGKTP